MPDQDSRHYEAAYRIPLIKAPTLRTPKPIHLPPDIHPLPDDVTPYFAYPFTLEPHTLTLESSRQTTLQAHQARNAIYLKAREDEKSRKKREALRKIAPGFEPSSGPLVPTIISHSRQSSTIAATEFGAEHSEHTRSDSVYPRDGFEVKERDVMDDLVDQLAAIDSARNGGT